MLVRLFYWEFCGGKSGWGGVFFVLFFDFVDFWEDGWEEVEEKLVLMGVVRLVLYFLGFLNVMMWFFYVCFFGCVCV